MTEPAPLSIRASFRVDWRWLGLLGTLPFLFLALLVLQPPFGLGRDFGNDFGDHRIWWVQMDAFWLSHGQVPLWNPVDQFGVLHVGARGMAGYYPFRWWLYLPAVWAPQFNYAVQYIQIALHLSLALTGVFALVRRHTSASPAAAAFATLPFLLTQRVVDFVRYPQGIEAASWLPWILVAALESSRSDLFRAYQVRWAWRLAAATALSCLAAYGHLTYMGSLVIGVVLLGAVRSWRELALPVGAALLGTVAAVGSLYPIAIQTVASRGRSGGDPGWANQFLAPGYLDVWLRPFAAEVHGSVFFPPVYLPLLALGVALALVRPPRRFGLAMLAALMLIADLAQGSNGLLFAWFYEHMPMYHAFRNHGRGFWPALIVVAYFAAQALAWAEQGRRRPLLVFLATLGATMTMGIAAWRTEGPALVPAGHFGYSALDLGWITPEMARWSYGAVLAAGVMALGACMLSRRSSWQMAGCVGLTAIFVFGFARSSTWFVTARPRSAETSTRAAYPSGLLAPYEAQPAGILGIWGRDDPPLAQFQRYAELQPAKTALFPGSRFYFLPETDTRDTAEVRVRNFDANHFDFEVRSTVPGTLLYFARPGQRREADALWRPWPQGEDLFMAFEVRPGNRLFEVAFVPPSVILAGLVSLCAVTALLALAIDPRMRSKGSRAVGIAGLGLVIFFLVGTLPRHRLDARTLTGVSQIDPFEWHPVPDGPQTPHQP